MLDYKKLGFKCGIEIHQQLEGKKLFCDCPTIGHDRNPDVFFERRLRASAGELGKIDEAALVEMKKDKVYKYEACSTSSCLVEYDGEPPHPVNKDALNTALEVALLLKMNVVDEVEFMRKVVIDGSNVSGFQRSALVSYGGYIETSKGKVRIPELFLEEEAAQRAKEDSRSVTFRLDRLGVPLLEIKTEADIKDAEHAKEVASIIGMILRSTGKVKRGIGTIRQDVNVSIKNHPRVEIKGFQELRFMEKVIENEVRRQIKEKKGESHVRKLNADKTTSFLRPMPGAARMYPETDCESVEITHEMLSGIKLPELIEDKISNLQKKYNLKSEYAKELVKKGINFEEFIEFDLDNNFIAKILIEVPKEIGSRLKLDVSKLKDDDFKDVFGWLVSGKISKGNVLEVLAEILQKGKVDLKKYESVSDKELEDFVKKLIKEKMDVGLGGLMGIIMGKFKGVDGKRVAELVKKYKK